jgi:hypothetical protein
LYACAWPQTGPLCALCEDGFYSQQPGEPCGACADATFQIVAFTLAAVVSAFLVMYYVQRTVSKANSEESSLTVLVKILFSAMQLNAIALTFSFSWNAAYTDMASVQSSVASIGTSVIYLQCLIGANAESGAFFLESLLFLLSPVLIFVVIATLSLPSLLYRIYRVQSTSWPEAITRSKRLARVAGVLIAFLLHPTLSQKAMQMFDCTELNDEWYVSQQMDEMCWSSTHIMWSILVGIPLVVLYAIGIPLYGFYILYMHRKQLGSGEFHQNFSFLYKGYEIKDPAKPFAYSWEIVVSSRKLALMFVSVFFYWNPPVQTAFGLMVVVIASMVQIQVQPFDRKSLNRAENWSLICSSLTFFLGSFTFLGEEYVSLASKQLVSYVALVINAVFLLTMLVWIAKAAKEKITSQSVNEAMMIREQSDVEKKEIELQEVEMTVAAA